MGELLVELVAQAGQLLGVAQFVGVDDLVELGGESVMEQLVGLCPKAGLGSQGAARLGQGVVGRVGRQLGLQILAVAAVLAGRLQRLGGRHGLGVLVLAVAVFVEVFATRLALAGAFHIIPVGLRRVLVAELEIVDQPPHRPGIGVLVVDVFFQVG